MRQNLILSALLMSLVTTTAQAGSLDLFKDFLRVCRGTYRGTTEAAKVTVGAALKKPLPPDEARLQQAQDMGFDVDPTVLKDIKKALSDYFEKENLWELGLGLNRANLLYGRSDRLGGVARKIIDDPSLTQEQKRAALVDKYYLDSTDILQTLRYRNGLENKYGYYELADQYRQFILNRRIERGELDIKTLSHDSTEGRLLFLPGPDTESLTVLGRSYNIKDPLNLIAEAADGKPIEVSDIKIIQEQQKGAPGKTNVELIFAAVVRAPKEGVQAKEGVTVTSPIPSAIPEQANFLVAPYRVSKDNVALTKNVDGSYSFYFEAGYRFSERIHNDQTPNGHDIHDVVPQAMADAGISDNQLSMPRYHTNGELRITLSDTVNPEARSRFEVQLARRVAELRDPVAARKSRRSPYPEGVDLARASKAELSGYETQETARAGLGLQNVNGGSTYYDKTAIWHSTYPTLQEAEGRHTLTVDDRYYGEFGSRGLEGIYEARGKPLTPVPTKGGGYAVYARATEAGMWSGYFETYFLFSTLEQAQEFAATHRFYQGK